MRGYEVFAHSRREVDRSLGRVSWHTGELTDETVLKDLLSVTKPDEIYNLAAVSRPALSWDIPIETALLNGLVPQRICEFIRREQPATRLFQASSSEIYGDSQAQLQDEQTRAKSQQIRARDDVVLPVLRPQRPLRKTQRSSAYGLCQFGNGMLHYGVHCFNIIASKAEVAPCVDIAKVKPSWRIGSRAHQDPNYPEILTRSRRRQAHNAVLSAAVRHC